MLDHLRSFHSYLPSHTLVVSIQDPETTPPHPSYFKMVSAKTLIAATTALAATTATAQVDPLKPFILTTAVLKGATQFDNLVISGFEINPERQTLIAHSDVPSAMKFTLKDTYMRGANLTRGPESLTLFKQQPDQSSSPAGYDYLELSDDSQPTAGFVFSETYALGYEAYAGGLGFSNWALCRVNGTAPRMNAGPQFQLLWKDAEPSHRSRYDTCADVALMASNAVE